MQAAIAASYWDVQQAAGAAAAVICEPAFSCFQARHIILSKLQPVQLEGSFFRFRELTLFGPDTR